MFEKADVLLEQLIQTLIKCLKWQMIQKKDLLLDEHFTIEKIPVERG